MGIDSTATDPVCGMTVQPESAAAKANYQGATYYFCSTHCHAKFQHDPTAYVTRSEAGPGVPGSELHSHRQPTPSAPSRTETTYICPMHPEIRQPGPGYCPKCGMALEPEVPVATTVEYTCPMHPEIVRSRPGNCPKCGMALEPRNAPAAE